MIVAKFRRYNAFRRLWVQVLNSGQAWFQFDSMEDMRDYAKDYALEVITWGAV